MLWLINAILFDQVPNNSLFLSDHFNSFFTTCGTLVEKHCSNKMKLLLEFEWTFITFEIRD